MNQDGPSLRYANKLDTKRMDMSTMRMCLHYCRAYHGKDGDGCSAPLYTKKTRPGLVPGLRLIDVRNLRIVESPPHEAEYACLSYTWGGFEAVTLERANLAKFTMPGGLGPDRAHLPETLRAAIHITEKLGYTYLWVDALCICQHDDPKDKQYHLGQMDRIYGDAVVTIVAADSKDANAGISGITYDRAVKQLGEEIMPGVYMILPMKHDLTLHPWDGRAWTLQERLLSKRLMLFSGGHVRFFCRNMSAHDDVIAEDAGPVKSPVDWTLHNIDRSACASSHIINEDGTMRLGRSAVFDQYTKIVQQYLRRSLSDQRDALPAVVGVLKLLESNDSASSSRSLQTMTGIPEQSLDLALLWYPSASAKTRLRRRPVSLGIPSWSWAAWEPVIEHSAECTQRSPQLCDEDCKQSRGAALEAVTGHRESCSARFRSLCDENCNRSQGAVRYEEPFMIQTDANGSLRKVITHASFQEEHVSPMLRWYRWKNMAPQTEAATMEMPQKSPPPVPSKPTAYKAAFKKRSTSHTGVETPQQRHEILTRRSTTNIKDGMRQLVPLNEDGCGILSANLESSYFEPRYDISLDQKVYNTCEPSEKHLVFVSSTTRFLLGTTHHRQEVLWRKTGRKIVAHQELDIFETDILDTSGAKVGRVILPDRLQRPYYPGPPPGNFDFIAISEAHFFGDEKQIIMGKFPLYNIMMVKWDDNRIVAERIALGKIWKHHWEAAKPKVRTIVLA